jgi:hypothetical protein
MCGQGLISFVETVISINQPVHIISSMRSRLSLRESSTLRLRAHKSSMIAELAIIFENEPVTQKYAYCGAQSGFTCLSGLGSFDSFYFQASYRFLVSICLSNSATNPRDLLLGSSNEGTLPATSLQICICHSRLLGNKAAPTSIISTSLTSWRRSERRKFWDLVVWDGMEKVISRRRVPLIRTRSGMMDRDYSVQMILQDRI